MLISQPLKKFEDCKLYIVEVDKTFSNRIWFCVYDDCGVFYTLKTGSPIQLKNVVEVREILLGDNNDPE